MRKSILFIISFGLTMVLSTGLAWSADSSIKFAYLGKPDPHKAAYTTGVVNFAHLMEKGSGGRLQVKIFPSGTLGKETDIMQAVKSNVVQMTSASMVTLSRIFPPAQAHFYTATPNVISAAEMEPWQYVDDIVTSPMVMENGSVQIPQSSGLGVIIDEDKVDYYRIEL